MIFVFFSIARTKLPGYVLSLYPLLAISVAKLFDDFTKGEDPFVSISVVRIYKGLAIFSIILAIVGVLFGLVEVQRNLKVIFFDINMMLLILGVGGIVSSIIFFKGKTIYNSIIALVITMVIFTFYTANYTMIHFDDFKPMRAVSRKILSLYESGDKIINYKKAGHSNSFVFYLDKPIIWADNRSELARALYARKRIFLIATKNDYYNMIKKSHGNLHLIYKSGELVLLSNYK